MEDCIFCKIISKEIPAEIVLESENFIIIKDVNPKVEGHSLIISKEHYTNFNELPSALYQEFLETIKKFITENEIENYNLAMNNGKPAGQIVPHAHLHILPRTENDGFKLSV